MTAKLRVGVVGLGGIAQKAWLPVLGAADGWTLQAAGRQEKRKRYASAKTGVCPMPSLWMRWRRNVMRYLSIPQPLHIMKWFIIC